MKIFTIATDRVGPRRWCRVRIHPTAEALQAAAYRQIYRMNVRTEIRLGRQCGSREEDLAYIYGELYGSFEAAGTPMNSHRP